MKEHAKAQNHLNYNHLTQNASPHNYATFNHMSAHLTPNAKEDESQTLPLVDNGAHQVSLKALMKVTPPGMNLPPKMQLSLKTCHEVQVECVNKLLRYGMSIYKF